ncbi:MAG: FAD-dependent oxidoreductase, partial [Flavobacteriales bacterium]
MSQKRIVIAGAGLVGSLTAVLLGRKGYKVTVLERRPDMRAVQIPAGRSINLAMSDRGWRALEKAGLAEEVRPIAIPMYKRTMHDEQKNLTYQPYGKDGEAIYSVSRGLLNKLLLSAAERDKEDVEILFHKRITDIDLDAQVLQVRDEESGQQQEIGYDILLGSDGAYSAVRNRLMYNDRFSYSQTYIEHGYKELHMPPGADGKHLMEVETLHIWPRGEYMMIAL